MIEQFGCNDPASSCALGRGLNVTLYVLGGKRAQKVTKSLHNLAGQSAGGEQAAAVFPAGGQRCTEQEDGISLMSSAGDNGKKTARAAQERGAAYLPQIVARASGWSTGVKTRV